MKRCLILVVAALLSFSITEANAEQIQFKKLPRVIQKFLIVNFQEEAVATIDKQVKEAATYYVVTLKGGTEVEFDNQGVIQKATAAKGFLLPNSLVPTQIITVMTKHYPLQQIVLFETIKDGYEISFANGGSITFSNEFDFRLINTRRN